MSASCHGDHCHATEAATASPRYRRVLWAALWINALMFAVEIVGGLQSGSVSLLADSVDFLGDAANYAVSLFVLGMAMVWRSRAAYAKGLVMGAFGHSRLREVLLGGSVVIVALLINELLAWHARSTPSPVVQPDESGATPH